MQVDGLKNKGFWIVFIPYIIFFFADMITTALNSSLLHILELNPLYKIFGSLIPIIILNILMVIVFYWMYHAKNSGPFNRYLAIMLMMIVMVMRIIAINNAITWYQTPNVDVQEIEAIYTPDVIQSAQIYYAGLMYSPILFCIVTFLLWYLDHRVVKKEKKNKKIV